MYFRSVKNEDTILFPFLCGPTTLWSLPTPNFTSGINPLLNLLPLPEDLKAFQGTMALKMAKIFLTARS